MTWHHQLPSPCWRDTNLHPQSDTKALRGAHIRDQLPLWNMEINVFMCCREAMRSSTLRSTFSLISVMPAWCSHTSAYKNNCFSKKQYKTHFIQLRFMGKCVFNGSLFLMTLSCVQLLWLRIRVEMAPSGGGLTFTPSVSQAGEAAQCFCDHIKDENLSNSCIIIIIP